MTQQQDNQRLRDAIKTIIRQRHAQGKTSSNSTVVNELKKQYGIVTDWETVSDIRFELRHEI